MNPPQPPTPSPPKRQTPPPKGAGKTNVAVLTILHQLGLHRGADGEIDKAAFKIVYIAPMKVGGFVLGLFRICLDCFVLFQSISLHSAHEGGGRLFGSYWMFLEKNIQKSFLFERRYVAPMKVGGICPGIVS
jgi:hypothetical protein